MSSLNSGDLNSIRFDRVQPVDSFGGQDKDRNKRKVLYKGRAWSEEEEDDIPLTVSARDSKQQEAEKETPKNIYANRLLVERAKRILREFATPEERYAQFCFYDLEANYDLERQKRLELLVQKGNVGGLFFSRGDFRREAFLIERMQGFVKHPLLVGNDFLHGLSFYFQRECNPSELESMTEIHLCDLGKAVTSQNRKLGVQLQLVREKNLSPTLDLSLGREKLNAFAHGIREAHGIVGREKKNTELMAPEHPLKSNSAFNLHPASIQEVFSLRTLYFLDLTRLSSEENIEKTLLTAFAFPFDILLLPSPLGGVPEAIASLVNSGQINAEELERRLLKVILLKMMAFPLRFR